MDAETGIVRVESGGAAPGPPTLDESALGPLLREMQVAVRDEITAAKKDPLRHLWVFEGEPIWENTDGTLVRFRCDRAPTLLPESPVAVLLDDDREIAGTLVAVEEFEVLVFLKEAIEDPIPRARLSSQPWFIHEALLQHIEGLRSQPHGDLSIPLAICGKTELPTTADRARAAAGVSALSGLADRGLQASAAQEQAIACILGSAVHYVWGPPGTGKTACLAQAVRTLVLHGERVLLLAHANVAVDVALLRVADAFDGTSELAEGRILRIGQPQLEEVRKRGPITPEAALEATQPDLIRRQDQLEAERRDLSRALSSEESKVRREALGKRLEAVRAALAEVRKQIDAALDKLVAESRVLAATLSRSAIDPRVQTWPAEALFLDEASMAPFPFFALAATFPGRRRCAVFGDFRQLPPIVQSKSKGALRWLGRDAFEIAGVVERIDSDLPEERVTLLDVQYRMAPPIAEIVSRASYGGRLRSGEGAGLPRGPVPVADPWRGSSVVFADTTYLGAACLADSIPGSFSRVNPLNALLAVDLAGRLRSANVEQVAVTTPYRAQARLLDRLLKRPDRSESVRAVTIHRFQGGERDLVILDLADAPPQKGPSRLTDRDPDLARRLLNVALSRARWKLIVVGAFDYLLRRSSAGGPLREVLGLLREQGTLWQPEPGELAGPSPGFDLDWLGDWSQAAPRLAGELDRAEDGLVVNWPGALPATREAVEALVRAGQRPSRPAARLYLPFGVAQRLESSGAELHLMERCPLFFARVAVDRLLLGGSESGQLFALVRGKERVEALLGALDPEMTRGVSHPAHVHHELDRRCGRCPECGEFRRPSSSEGGDWSLRCTTARHSGPELSREELSELVEVLEIRCPNCGGRVRAEPRKGGRMKLACENRQRACRPAALPDLEDLF